MKTIENKTTLLKEWESFLDYWKLMSVCINSPQKDWYTVEQMKKLLRITDILDKKDSKEFSFEDEDYKTLVSKIDNMKRWAIHKDIVEFTDYIKSAS